MGESSGGPGEPEDLGCLATPQIGNYRVCVCVYVCVCVCVCVRTCISREQGAERERQPACPEQQVYMRLQHESNREEKNDGKKKKKLH